jgi:hypothetical protein
MDKLMQEANEMTKMFEPEEREYKGSKQWTECTHDERHELLEQLRGLYLQNGLTNATINLQKQIGMNLMKNGARSSEEEFLFSENLFGIKQEDAVERFSQ